MHRNAGIFLLEILLSRIALFMSMPFLSVYLAEKTQLNQFQIGIVIGINSVMSLVAIPAVRSLEKHMPLSWTMRGIPLLWGMTLFCFPHASHFFHFIFLNGLNGLFYAVYEPNIKRALSLFSAKEQRLKVYNLRYLAINIGAVFGPFASQWLGFECSLRGYYLLGGVYLAIGVLNLFLKFDCIDSEKIQEEKKNESATLHQSASPLLFLIIGTSFSYLAYSQLSTTVSQYLSRHGCLDGYRHLLSAASFLIIAMQWPVLKLTCRWSSSKVLMASNFCFASYLVAVPFLGTLAGQAVFLLLYVIGELLLGARFDFALDSIASKGNKSFCFSAGECVKFGSALGPVAGGQLIHLFHWHRSFLIFGTLAMLTLTGSIFLFLFGRKEKTFAKSFTNR